jgi:hypothetical protein
MISASTLKQVISREKNNSGSSFTVKSIATGKDYTYKISRSEWKGKWYTHVKVETQYLDFKRLGSYFGGKLYNRGSVVSTPSAVAISFVLNKVEQNEIDWLDGKVEIMHLGSCMACGKTLTDANSIELGLGPVCAG